MVINFQINQQCYNEQHNRIYVTENESSYLQIKLRILYTPKTITTIPVYVRELSKEDAVINFVDCNLCREKILPSEKARAYKMKHDAIKKQGTRTDLTSSQVGTKFRSDEKLAERLLQNTK